MHYLGRSRQTFAEGEQKASLQRRGRNSKNNPGPVWGPCAWWTTCRGEMRNVCSIRLVAGDGGLNTEVGLGLSIDHSVADPVRAVLEVKDQEISLTHTHI